MTEEFENKSLGGKESSGDDRLWVFLTYIFTPFVPILIMLMEDKKERPFIKSHNAQALVWGVLALVIGLPASSITCGLASFTMWAISVYWGYQGYQGQTVKIPVITDFVKNQGWD